MDRRIIFYCVLFIFAVVIVAQLWVWSRLAQPATVELMITQVVENEVIGVGEPQIVTQVVELEATREVLVVVEPTPQPVEQPQADVEMPPSTVYRLALLGAPQTLNYWRFVADASSIDESAPTKHALSGVAPTLYTLSPVHQQWVPALAADLATETTIDADGNAVLTVELLPNALWSDGEAIDASDVAFTLNTCLDLQLGGAWQAICRPDRLLRVDVINLHTVAFVFDSPPGLGEWQYGVSQAPILPEQIWRDVAAEARMLIDGVTLPAVCGDGTSDEDRAACAAYAAAHDLLFSAETPFVSGDGLLISEYDVGKSVRKVAQPNYYAAGVTIIETSDGQYKERWPDGRERAFYGDGSGMEVVNYVRGPFNEQVDLLIYESADAAYAALAAGEIDMVLQADDSVNSDSSAATTVLYQNPANNLNYLAFNLRKAPFDDLAFRTAIEIVVDKSFVTSRILQDVVMSADSVVPAGNVRWHVPIASPYTELSRAQRIEFAVSILQDAGYSWDIEPQWNKSRDDVDPGAGFRLPDGSYMPTAMLLGPSPEIDPQRAGFNQWVSEWVRELGIPLESQLTDFDTLLGPIFTDASFDMYILGWGLPLYPDYLCDYFMSKNDTVTSGNFNTTGFASDRFDAECAAFLAEADVSVAYEQAVGLQTMVADAKPYLPLFYKRAYEAVSTSVTFPYAPTLGGVSAESGFQVDAQIMR